MVNWLMSSLGRSVTQSHASQGSVLLTVVLVLFLQVVGVVAVAIGLGDTWLDWRRRPRPKTQRSE
jgi:hypothetical protein